MLCCCASNKRGLHFPCNSWEILGNILTLIMIVTTIMTTISDNDNNNDIDIDIDIDNDTVLQMTEVCTSLVIPGKYLEI